MNRIRRWAAAFAALSLIVTLGASAEGEWNYVLKTDGSARLTGYQGRDDQATVPAEVDGYPVTELGGRGFQAQKDLSLPEGVEWTADVPETDGVTEEGLRYALRRESRKAVITGYEGDNARVIIPRMIENCAVTGIARDAFADNGTVTHVLLPDTLREVGDRAFMNCKRLEQIHFDRDLRVIGEYAFCGCEALDVVVLPKTLTCVGAYAFAYTALKRVSLPENVEVIGESAFDHIPTLCYARISGSVRVIERYAFAEAPLRRVKLPESVVRIGAGAFATTAYLTAEDALLKASLPELGVTEADLTKRDWPGRLEKEEKPLVTIGDFELQTDKTADQAAIEASVQAIGKQEETQEAVAEDRMDSEEAQPRKTAEEPFVRITSRSRAKIRSNPGKQEGVVVCYAEKGETFPYLWRAEDGWIALRLPDGAVGYVAKGMVEIVGLR